MEVLNYNSREEHTNNEHLNLLSVFYFVFGGLSLFVAFIFLVYTIVIGAIFSSNTVKQAMQAEPDAKVVEYVFGVVAIVFLVVCVLILAVGILQIMAGFRIRQKRSRTFNIVIAVIALLSFPLGTLLGVFTIIVLSRPAVIEMFRKEQERIDLEKFGKIG